MLSNQFVVPSAEADDLLKSVRGLRLLRCVDEDDSDRCVGYSIVRAHRVLAPWCPTRYLERGPGCEGCGSAQWRQAHGPLIAAYDARYLDVPDDIGTVVIGALDFDRAVGVMRRHPVQEQLFPIIFVKLGQTELPHRRSGLEEGDHGSRIAS